MHAVVGLGQTGFSVMAFLRRQGLPFFACDTRLHPPGLEVARKTFPDAEFFLGDLPEAKLLAAEKIILSPGLPREQPVLQKALSKKIPVIGDIELFVQAAKAPIIAITGTNAKGTVTTMVQSILEAANLRVWIGGNFGVPALDLLEKSIPDFYVLELSSFQLESTFSLKAAAATILNITEDHLDYHHSMENYIAAKQRIYRGAKSLVVNAEDRSSWPEKMEAYQKIYRFSGEDFFVKNHVLMFRAQEILPVDELSVVGVHNWANALAASALAVAVGISIEVIRTGLKKYSGLKHRCALVVNEGGVRWFNDSKGTNVGATQAAIQGLGPTLQGKMILIAGGQAKGQDFSPLQSMCQRYVKALILLGQDAGLLEEALAEEVPECVRVNTLEEAVIAAKKIAQVGDAVLLSPACASLDMFKNYADRGDQFEALLHDIVIANSDG